MKCPGCRTRNQPAAQFCGRCGEALVAGARRAGESGDRQGAGPSGARVHPDPVSPPSGFRPCDGMPDLHYRWQAAWGGAMLVGTEAIAVLIFNGGYPLEEVALKLHGLDAEGEEAFVIEKSVAHLPRGEEVTIEVPSYELPVPASDITVALLSARYGSAT